MLVMNLPAEEIRIRLGELCQPIIERLQMVSSPNFLETSILSPMRVLSKVLTSTPVVVTNNENEKAADSWARIASEPVLWIDRIATIFREVRPWNGGNLVSEESFEGVSSISRGFC